MIQVVVNDARNNQHCVGHWRGESARLESEVLTKCSKAFGHDCIAMESGERIKLKKWRDPREHIKMAKISSIAFFKLNFSFPLNNKPSCNIFGHKISF